VAEPVERRLTTILATDVAEYSRLMRADEDGTLALLTRCRKIAAARIAAHRGRIANTAGYAVLAEFPSVADGLSCALAIQQVVGEENAALPSNQPMLFRIGVHLGDVMARDGDLFGDAVNVAARLQALAEPCGICVSSAVREHAGSRIPAAFTDAGAQQVENIAEPVHVFGWRHERRRRSPKPWYPSHCPASRRLRYCRSPNRRRAHGSGSRDVLPYCAIGNSPPSPDRRDGGSPDRGRRDPLPAALRGLRRAGLELAADAGLKSLCQLPRFAWYFRPREVSTVIRLLRPL
jgi:class 3 adenylate cyclase